MYELGLNTSLKLYRKTIHNLFIIIYFTWQMGYLNILINDKVWAKKNDPLTENEWKYF